MDPTTGEINIEWLNNYNITSEGSQAAFELEFYYVDKEISGDTAPNLTNAELVSEKTMIFTGPEYIKGDDILHFLASINTDESPVNFDSYIGIRGRAIDLGEKCIASDWITFLNTRKFSLIKLPTFSEIYMKVNTDVSADDALPTVSSIGFSNFYTLNYVDRFIGAEDISKIRYEFAVFSVGDTLIEDVPAFPDEEDIVLHYVIEDTVETPSRDNFLQLFKDAGIYDDGYYGVMGRVAVKPDITGDIYSNSDWEVFRGSAQYEYTIFNHGADVKVYSSVTAEGKDPNSIIDGNTNSGYQPGNDVVDYSLVIDLGEVININELIFYWENAGPLTYDIYVGSPYLTDDDLFDRDSPIGWKNVASAVGEPIAGDTSHNINQKTVGINAIGRYVLIDLKGQSYAPYAANLFEVVGHGSRVEGSIAYHTLKHVLDTLECQDFSGKDAPAAISAKEVNEILLNLQSSLEEGEDLKLQGEAMASEPGFTYGDRLAYFLDRSAYYSGGANPALVINHDDSVGYIAVIASLIVLGGGASFLLIKRKKEAK